MRNMSLSDLQALLAEDDAGPVVATLEVNSPELVEPGRFVADNVPLTLGGHTYLASGFDLVLAAESDEAQAQAKLRVANVGLELMDLIRSATVAPQITGQLVRRPPGAPASVVVGDLTYDLLSVSADALVIEGTLGLELDFLNDAATAGAFVPATFPGLFV